VARDELRRSHKGRGADLSETSSEGWLAVAADKVGKIVQHNYSNDSQ